MLVLFVIIIFGFQSPQEEAISPTERAKEYMDSRPSKVSPSTLSLQSHSGRYYFINWVISKEAIYCLACFQTFCSFF